MSDPVVAAALRRMGVKPENIPGLLAVAKERGKPLAAVVKESRCGLSADRMNKLERACSLELASMQASGVATRWRFGQVKLRLADNTWYTVDFQVWLADGRIIMLETKGFLRDDASVKFKVAREQYPEYLWIMVRRKKGMWQRVMGDVVDVFSWMEF